MEQPKCRWVNMFEAFFFVLFPTVFGLEASNHDSRIDANRKVNSTHDDCHVAVPKDRSLIGVLKQADQVWFPKTFYVIDHHLTNYLTI